MMESASRRTLLSLLIVTCCVSLAAAASDIRLRTYEPARVDSSRVRPAGSVDYVIIIDIDGLKREVLYSLLADTPEKIPNISSLVGDVSHYSETDDFIFHEALGVNRATTVCPSVTLPSQFAIVTGRWPKNHGVPANLWFSRSLGRTIDITVLLDKILPSSASESPLNPSILDAASAEGMTCVSGLNNMTSALDVPQPVPQVSIDPVAFDTAMTNAILSLINRNGIPQILLIYYPGNDVNSHSNGAETQAEYLSDVMDPLIGNLLHGDGGSLLGLLDVAPNLMDRAVFVFCADHGHINISPSADHSIGSEDLSPCLASAGYTINDNAMFEANGGAGLLYLKNRATDTWTRPSFLRDVLPAARAIVDSRAALGDFLDFMLIRVNESPDGAAYRVLDPDTGRIRSVQAFFRGRDQDYPDAVQRVFGTDPSKFGDIVLFPNREDGHDFAESPGAASDHGSLTAVESYVPMIFAGAVHPRTVGQARNIDVAPTIADLLGLRRHWQNGDGQSLLIGR